MLEICRIIVGRQQEWWEECSSYAAHWPLTWTIWLQGPRVLCFRPQSHVMTLIMPSFISCLPSQISCSQLGLTPLQSFAFIIRNLGDLCWYWHVQPPFLSTSQRRRKADAVYLQRWELNLSPHSLVTVSRLSPKGLFVYLSHHRGAKCNFQAW